MKNPAPFLLLMLLVGCIFRPDVGPKDYNRKHTKVIDSVITATTRIYMFRSINTGTGAIHYDTIQVRY